MLESIRKAVEEENFTEKEKEALTAITDELQERGNRELRSKPLGSGRIYWVESYPEQKFLIHKATKGYNIIRVE